MRIFLYFRAVDLPKESNGKEGFIMHTCTCDQNSTGIWEELLTKFAEDPSVSQLLFVKCGNGSNAQLFLYEKSAGQWTLSLSCPAFIGQNGLGKEKEGDRKTPVGVFDLPVAFGIMEDPGSKVSYAKVHDKLYWCGDKEHYNQLIDITQMPHDCQGEHLIDCAPEYHYAMFIAYNQEGVYGKGSAIFLHCTGKNPYTAGCVAVSEEHMKTILQTVTPGVKICIYPETF